MVPHSGADSVSQSVAAGLPCLTKNRFRVENPSGRKAAAALQGAPENLPQMVKSGTISALFIGDTKRVVDVTTGFLPFFQVFATLGLPTGTAGKDEKTMRETARKNLLTGAGFLGAFAVWTLLIQCVDVQATGPQGTKVGFASVNILLHRLTGEHLLIYTVTDWLGLVPIFICMCFGALGFVQLIQRQSLLRVDTDLILLGVYYTLVIAAYLIFEMIPINYRPMLIEGRLEASYPSSTTLLVLSVLPTLVFQINRRAENTLLRRAAAGFAVCFSAFMVVGRLVSGVHWATDIAASVLLSSGLYLLYRAAVLYISSPKEERWNSTKN